MTLPAALESPPVVSLLAAAVFLLVLAAGFRWLDKRRGGER